jgi:YQGE family putative transporter
MLQMAVLKGLAQGFIKQPRDAYDEVFCSEALGTAQSVGAIIAAVIMLILVNYRHHRLRF